MDILYNNNLINEIVDKLFKHKRTDYSEFNLGNSLTMQRICCICRNWSMRCCVLPIRTTRKYTHRSSKKVRSRTYASSLCMVMAPIDWSAPIFSRFCRRITLSAPSIFQGAGRARATWSPTAWRRRKTLVKVGLRRDSIINYLRQQGFKKFILWGRSMGATSALLYCLKYNPEDVILQIIDSAFYSFEMIAF